MAVEVKDKLVTVESAKVIHDSLNEKIEAHANSTANPHGVSPSQIGAVPTSRQINGKALSQNINLVPSDIGAAAEGHTHAVDEALSESSTNPVQNKIVSAAISQLSNENANLRQDLENEIEDIKTNFSGTIDIDLEGSNEGEINPVNADTLGGYLPEHYATVDDINSKLAMEPLWENASPTSSFAAGTILDNYDFSKCVAFLVYYRCSTTIGTEYSHIVFKEGSRSCCFGEDNNFKTTARYCGFSKEKNVLNFSNGYICNTYGTFVENPSYMIPIRVLGIKGVL